MTSSKPHQVILWGSFAPLHDYLALLHEAQIQVACLVDPLNERTGGGAVPVRSVPGFCQDIEVYRGVPIVVLENRRSSSNSDPLWEAVKTLTYELQIDNRLLDPVFVADYVPLRFPGRILAGGFPGSGNGVVQATIETLLPEPAEPLAGREHLVSFLAGQRHGHLHHRLERSFPDIGRKVSGMSHQRYGRVNWLAMGHTNEIFVLYDLPDRAHLLSTVHKTHEILSSDIFDRFVAMEYRPLVAMRHPLDTLVSMAAKLCKPPSLVLANLEWFQKMATALRDYCAAVLDADDRATLVHYERLITDPLVAITEIAAAMGRDCSPQRASDVWEQVGFRPLHFSPGHLWQPGVGKWRKYLCQAHLEIVGRLGLDTLAAELGYHDIQPHSVGATALEAPPAAMIVPPETAVGDHTFSRLFRLPPTFLHPDVLFEEDPSGIGWLSNNRWHTQHYVHLMQSPPMRRYLLSLDRPAEAFQQRRAA